MPRTGQAWGRRGKGGCTCDQPSIPCKRQGKDIAAHRKVAHLNKGGSKAVPSQQRPTHLLPKTGIRLGLNVAAANCYPYTAKFQQYMYKHA